MNKFRCGISRQDILRRDRFLYKRNARRFLQCKDSPTFYGGSRPSSMESPAIDIVVITPSRLKLSIAASFRFRPELIAETRSLRSCELLQAVFL